MRALDTQTDLHEVTTNLLKLLTTRFQILVVNDCDPMMFDVLIIVQTFIVLLTLPTLSLSLPITHTVAVQNIT